MIPDHDCVPGLERPVTVREYARLEGLSEAQVLTLIQQLKLRKAAYFRGQWFIEAPPNCEARLAQLRGKQPTPRNDKANVPRKGKGNIPALEDEEFWGPIEREAADAEQNVMLKATEHLHGPRPQPTRESAPEPKSAPAQPRTVGERPQPIVPDHVPGLERPVTLGEYAKLQGLREEDMLAVIGQLKIPSAYFQGQWYVEAPLNCEARLAQLRGEQQDGANKATEIRENISQQPAREPRQTNKIPSIDALRISIGRKMWGYDDLSDAEKKALLNKPGYANYPQPIDYGLTRDDMDLHAGKRMYRVKDDVRYKEGSRWFGVFLRWKGSGNAGGLAFWLLLIGILSVTNKDSRAMGFILLGVGLACVLYAMLPGILLACADAHPGLKEFEEALRLHNLYEVASYDAQQEVLKRKRSYWEVLDGYSFEQATAEVLRKHQFTALVTRGSGDGGVDIEITRNGLQGVVQCKAHVNCVGPSVVRDLYGVIHHSGAAFGIVVSRGGFTRGAHDFRRDKPILFLDTDDLIAMQEGRDVLGKAFSPSSPVTKS